jgi:hypothetical protein
LAAPWDDKPLLPLEELLATGSVAITAAASTRLGWLAQSLWQHAVASQAGYTPGDAITVNAGLRYADMGQAVVPLFQVNYVHRNIDRGNLVNVEFDGSPLTGGDLVYLALGVSARLGAGFSVYGYVQFSVYQDVNGDS